MGRIQTAFNIIACLGAAFHILGGLLAVYFLIPKGGEEILSRRARSIPDEVNFDPEPINQLTNQNNQPIRIQNQNSTNDANLSNGDPICNTAANCEDCLSVSRKCFWFENSRKSYCFNVEGGSLRSLSGEFDEGLENVSWGSCKAPLTVSLFLLFSIVLVLIIFVAFVTVHFFCSNNKETEMLIEADLAAKNEKYLERLGKLNPLPFKTQD